MSPLRVRLGGEGLVEGEWGVAGMVVAGMVVAGMVVAGMLGVPLD